MSKVYITNASLKRIVSELQYNKNNRDYLLDDVSNEIAEDDIFTRDEINNIFNTNELQNIYKTKMALKDFGNIIENIQQNKKTIEVNVNYENKKYINKVKAPSYHSNKACKWMYSNFKNIKIPQNCLDDIQHETTIRQWINQNKQLQFQELNSLFMRKFNCSEGLEEVNIENSGSTSIENYKINFVSESKKCRLQLKFLLDGELGKKLANYRYMPKYKLRNFLKNENDINLHQPLIELHEAKDEFKNIIINFYQKKYNLDLEFDKNLLDAIGFKACRACS